VTKKKNPNPTPRSRSDSPRDDDAIITTALTWSLALFAVIGTIAGVSAYVLTRPPAAPPVVESELAKVEIREVVPMEIPTIPFTDITQQAGIRFYHENGAVGQKLLPETMGGGCAFFDYDNDSDQDILFVNSQQWPWNRKDSNGPAATAALYRNDGSGNFEDVTAGSGFDLSLYGMGVATGDYDNDGLVDVFFSAVGSNRLFHNEGDGTFRDVTEQAGVAGNTEDWGSSCGWFDYDNDGDLDLFVCNYVEWSREYDEAQDFQLTGGGRAYGAPQNFGGTFPYLYRNDGEGRFEEVAEAAGLHVRNSATGVPVAKSLGVTFADFDHDGWIDIVVANDTVQNFLFHNQGDGTFEEVATVTGVAFDMSGNARGAMGIDIANFRNNDALGIAIGNFANEMTALYVCYDRDMHFVDEAISSGLGPCTRLALTFGVLYADCDLDGRLDLFAANGHLEEDINRVQPSQHYEQPPQLFWNCGPEQDTEFVPMTEELCGSDLFRPLVGRGASYADIDSDGDLDLLITATGQPPRLLRNDQQQTNHWLRLRLIGTHSNRDAIGAQIEIDLGDRVLRRQVMPTRSYLSQAELPVTFGLGDCEGPVDVTILWPDRSVQMVEGMELNGSREVVQQ
jgi:enediyne biosynthesis protein E4